MRIERRTAFGCHLMNAADATPAGSIGEQSLAAAVMDDAMFRMFVATMCFLLMSARGADAATETVV